MLESPQLHHEIYRARDQRFYTRVEVSDGELTHAGPFPTAEAALQYLQLQYNVGQQFVFDDSGRRSVPTIS